jgi:hypothetical protein
MNGETRVRVLVSVPIELRQKINQNIKTRPDTENEKILKCVIAGYKAIMGTQKFTSIPQYVRKPKPPQNARAAAVPAVPAKR